MGGAKPFRSNPVTEAGTALSEIHKRVRKAFEAAPTKDGYVGGDSSVYVSPDRKHMEVSLGDIMDNWSDIEVSFRKAFLGVEIEFTDEGGRPDGWHMAYPRIRKANEAKAFHGVTPVAAKWLAQHGLTGNPKTLGRGQGGVVLKFNSSKRVVKVARLESREGEAALIIKKLKLKTFVKVDAVARIDGQDWIIRENVRPFSDANLEFGLVEPHGLWLWNPKNAQDAVKAFEVGLAQNSLKKDGQLTGELNSVGKAMMRHKKSIIAFWRDWLKAKKAGMEFTDLQPGQWGMRGKDIVLFDLGDAELSNAPKVPVVESKTPKSAFPGIKPPKPGLKMALLKARARKAFGKKKKDDSFDTVSRILEARKEYRRAGSQVSGLKVMRDVPNTRSIDATFGEYEILKGIREVPLSEFDPVKYYAADDNQRVRELADEIKANGWISPLIVVQDQEPRPYVLEGGHRLAALQKLKVKSLPAMVVLDLDDASFESLDERIIKAVYFRSKEPLSVIVPRRERQAGFIIVSNKAMYDQYKKGIGTSAGSDPAYNYIYKTVKPLQAVDFTDPFWIKKLRKSTVFDVDALLRDYDAKAGALSSRGAADFVDTLRFSQRFTDYYPKGFKEFTKVFPVVILRKKNMVLIATDRIEDMTRLIDGNIKRFERKPGSEPDDIIIPDDIMDELKRYTEDPQKRLRKPTQKWLMDNIPRRDVTVYRGTGVEIQEFGEFFSKADALKRMKRWFGVTSFLDVFRGGKIKVKRGKLSSWSYTPQISREFSSGMAKRDINLLLRAKIPAKKVVVDIASLPKRYKDQLMFSGQNEVIVASGVIPAEIVDVWVDNAYREQFDTWLADNFNVRWVEKQDRFVAL